MTKKSIFGGNLASRLEACGDSELKEQVESLLGGVYTALKTQMEIFYKKYDILINKELDKERKNNFSAKINEIKRFKKIEVDRLTLLESWKELSAELSAQEKEVYKAAKEEAAEAAVEAATKEAEAAAEAAKAEEAAAKAAGVPAEEAEAKTAAAEAAAEAAAKAAEAAEEAEAALTAILSPKRAEAQKEEEKAVAEEAKEVPAEEAAKAAYECKKLREMAHQADNRIQQKMNEVDNKIIFLNGTLDQLNRPNFNRSGPAQRVGQKVESVIGSRRTDSGKYYGVPAKKPQAYFNPYMPGTKEWLTRPDLPR